MPLWFTAELQGEWAESVCDVSWGSHFTWRDERVNRLQIRGHRGIAQRKKNNTVPYKCRCVAANCRNVVDLSEGTFVHNIPFFGDKTTIS